MRYLILCLGLLCCQKTPSKLDDWRSENDKVKVLCTTPIVYDLVSKIGGERVDSISLMDPAIDPHSYELVKGDDEKFSRAHIVFCNGLGLEHSGGLLTQMRNHPHLVSIGEEIDPTCVLQERGQIDPHIWLDVSIWEKCIDPIVTHLSQEDPEGALFYAAQGAAEHERLHALDEWIQTKMQSVPSNKKFLVTSHDAFNYYARRYLHENGEWKDRFCAPEGLAPDGQLGFQDLERVIQHLLKNRVETVFSEANVSKDSLKKIIDICQDKNMVCSLSQELLFSDTLSDSASHVFTYEEMMKHNTDVLCNTWSAP